MNFIKRAGLYCIRQRFKTFLLFLALTLIAALMLTGISIQKAFARQAADVRTAVGGKIIIDTDTEGHMGDSRQNEWGTVYCYNGDYITQEIVDAVIKVEGVADYNSEETNGFYGAGVNFRYLPASLQLSYTPYGEASGYTVTLSSEKCRAFQSGKYKLTAGRHIMPEDKYACLISRELADYNNLSVGDKIKMYSLDADSEVSFEIVGIFNGTEGASGNALTVDEIPANCGYLDFASVQDIFKGIDEEGYQQLTVYVKDPGNIQSVYDKISALPELKGKTLKLTVDTEEMDAISAPLESLQKSVITAILLISVVSIVILSMLLTVWVRGRKKEIGILLSVGKSKPDILLQLFAEAFFVAVISFTVSIPASFFTAEKAGTFLASQMTAGTAGLQISVDVSCLLPLLAIGILLIAVSVFVSSWTVIRLQPKDILIKMS